MEEFGEYGNSEVFSTSETIVACCIVVPIGLFMLIKKPIHTSFAYHLLMIGGMILAGGCTFAVRSGKMSGFSYMIVTGVGLYICWIPFSNILFEALIAAFQVPANSGFIMYLCDSGGYLASIAVNFVRNFGSGSSTWLTFFFNLTFGMTALGIFFTAVSLGYFLWKYHGWTAPTQEEPEGDEKVSDEKVPDEEVPDKSSGSGQEVESAADDRGNMPEEQVVP
jgi:hypothetical protein